MLINNENKNNMYQFSIVETSRKFIITKLENNWKMNMNDQNYSFIYLVLRYFSHTVCSSVKHNTYNTWFDFSERLTWRRTIVLGSRYEKSDFWLKHAWLPYDTGFYMKKAGLNEDESVDESLQSRIVVVQILSFTQKN